LELAFANKPLRDHCESQLKAERRFGIGIARNLRARLADLREADSITDLVAGEPRVFSGGEALMTVSIGGGLRIVFRANHVKNPFKRDGDVDWTRVSRIKIIDIGADQ
jgi:proteic killer suppression protein